MLFGLLFLLGPLSIDLSVSALKLPTDDVRDLADLHALEREIQDGDRRDANFALLAAANRGGQQHVSLVLALLAAEGYDVDMLQQWFSGGGVPPFVGAAGIASEAKRVALARSFQSLLEGIRADRPQAAKALIVKMAEDGGQARVSNTLKALLLLGYDVKAFQTWIEGGPALPKPSPAKVAQNPWHMHLLIEALQRADRKAVKKVLAGIVRQGGLADMTRVLGSFAAMGYDYVGLMQWLQSEEGAKPPSKPKIADPELALLLQGLQAGDRSQVKLAFAGFLKKGDLSTVFAKLQAMGYDLEKIKRWYKEDLQFRRGQEFPIRADSHQGRLQASSASEAHSEMLTRAFVNSDALMAKRLPLDMVQHGGKDGETDVATVFGHLQSSGFQVASMGNRLNNQTHSNHSNAFRGHHKGSGVLQEVAGADSSSEDSKVLAASFKNASKETALRYMAHMLGNGGTARIEKAIAGVSVWGSDPGSSQIWLDGRANLSKTPKHSSPRKSSPEATTAGTGERSFQQVLEGVQQANKTQVVQQLALDFNTGGLARVQDTFAQLEKAGYHAAELQAWLAGRQVKPPAVVSRPKTQRAHD